MDTVVDRRKCNAHRTAGSLAGGRRGPGEPPFSELAAAYSGRVWSPSARQALARCVAPSLSPSRWPSTNVPARGRAWAGWRVARGGGAAPRRGISVAATGPGGAGLTTHKEPTQTGKVSASASPTRGMWWWLWAAFESSMGRAIRAWGHAGVRRGAIGIERAGAPEKPQAPTCSPRMLSKVCQREQWLCSRGASEGGPRRRNTEQPLTRHSQAQGRSGCKGH